MTTKALINNIEKLSVTLNEGQLIQFLDIMDAMAALLAEAQGQDIAKQVQSQAEFSAILPVGIH
ncbi:hypothetical protein [Bowmanella yangjiangensis]|uniref:Uncharacterized protein n=1 Tax=Bowmanella yangjiangensis TaxID=2811230 RepID=A0ABS3CRG9_9ALTE|nr:hypothetical protein [Bowmanella yangjiangensis]MBN7819708.1 hypothetical protein [Bowmanella yangjiangensis]